MMKQVSQFELKNMLAEASHALAHLDADRLEKMALSCAALVRDMDGKQCGAKTQGESGSFEVTREMAFFAGVLEATRTNLRVIRRLRELHAASLDYGLTQTGSTSSEEMKHGDH